MDHLGELTTIADRLRCSDLTEGVRTDHPLGRLTTYRVGGSAALFVRPADLGELSRVAEAVSAVAVPVLVVGRGSNLLVADTGFEGLAIQLGPGFEEVGVAGTRLTAGGAASLPTVARLSVAEGLAGFEWAVGVPGSIGGAVRMNAGGHGSEMSEVVEAVTLVDLTDGDRRTVPVGGLDLGYRRSSVADTQVVASVTLRLDGGARSDGEELLAEIVRWRRENQPGGQNSGSVFTNPPGDSAGRLIELAGGKGLRIGSAVVSERHANFIQADSGGSAIDVLLVMTEVQRLVAEAHGIELTPETVLVGFNGGRG